MSILRTLLALLGTLWAFPGTLLHLIVTGIGASLGLLRYTGRYRLALVFQPRFGRTDRLGAWWEARWEDWGGSCPGTAVIWAKTAGVVPHEYGHTVTGWLTGLLFLPLYGLLLPIFGYRDHPFERLARWIRWRFLA